MILLRLWNKLLNLGVSDDYPEETILIQFFNKMSIFSFATGLIISVLGCFLDVPIEYLIISVCITIMYFSFLILNAYGKILFGRVLNAITAPMFICAAHALIGGFFSQSLVICTSIVITFVAFQKHPKLRVRLIIFTVVIYIIAILYTAFYGPILGVLDYPFDDIFVFMATTGWMMGALMILYEEREEYIKSLSEKNKQLEEATEELERFSYIASHDLKSPLRTITSFIGLIERDINKQNFDAINEKLHFVKTGAEQMNFLVQDILELSKLKHTEQSERVLIDLNVILEKAKANLTEEIRSRKVKIYAEKLPTYKGNEVEMLLLFQNFIQNGIKYNESETPIVAISSFETKDSLCLSFRDNGIGIAEQYYDQIFQFFKRLHNSDEYQGTGLGLGLCKKIIKSYSGEVEVDSVVGAGSTFTIKFPLEKNQIVDTKNQPREVAST